MNMRLYLIRHAEAAPLGEHGTTDDEERPLTEKGRAQCGPLAMALRRLGVELSRLLTSPLLRARQTAEALRSSWGEIAPEIVECRHLAPGGKKRKILDRLREQHADAVGLVGHNPDLSVLAAWLVGDKNVSIELDKAGVACIEFEGSLGKGKGTLRWMVTPEWCVAWPRPTRNRKNPFQFER